MRRSLCQRSDIKLADWFLRGARALPWREDPSFYRVWVSEIMLQQTQVITVIPYFEKFMSLFPTVHALASEDEETVMKAWAGLGYYSRARSLRKGAQLLSARLLAGLDWPCTREAWLEIPGVGPYTAGAILSIAGHLPEALLDGNVERVLSRFFAVDRIGGDSVYKQRLWKLSREWVEGAFTARVDPSVTNQALMELGARVCVPREPRCGVCPLASGCLAHQQERVSEFPPKKARAAFLDVQETAYCFLDSKNRVLLEKSKAWRAGLWDLPLKAEEKNLDLKILGEVLTKHIVTRHRITRKTLIIKCGQYRRKGNEVTSFTKSLQEPSQELSRWVSLKSILSEKPELALGSAAVKTLKAVSQQLDRCELSKCSR